jgi:predicted metal-dependent phosphoesterase TrpH
MSTVNLHVHTNVSDGRYSPSEVVQRAVRSGLRYLAITDHDTVSGIAAALETARAYPGLTLIPGVEINTDVPSGEAHVLGYFIDHTHQELLTLLSEMRCSRQERAQSMIAKLESLGIRISWERVKEIAKTDAIGRPHIAQALLEKGYITDLKEAFDRYIGRDKPAYVERTKVSPLEATRLISRANGLPVLAHPLTVADPEVMTSQLKEGGLVGLEVYYGGYSAPDVSRLLTLAAKYDLIATGGSDFHGLDEKTETPLGRPAVPLESARQLINLAKRRLTTWVVSQQGK